MLASSEDTHDRFLMKCLFVAYRKCIYGKVANSGTKRITSQQSTQVSRYENELNIHPLTRRVSMST
ncbi:hypothetical protein C0J52_28403 [Blattella germanica]|nr:hypothetical protein C0J52_28403 [Blattella germanica]